MADYDIKLDKAQLVGLLSKSEVMADLVSGVINQVLEVQMTEHLRCRTA